MANTRNTILTMKPRSTYKTCHGIRNQCQKSSARNHITNFQYKRILRYASSIVCLSKTSEHGADSDGCECSRWVWTEWVGWNDNAPYQAGPHDATNTNQGLNLRCSFVEFPRLDVSNRTIIISTVIVHATPRWCPSTSRHPTEASCLPRPRFLLSFCIKALNAQSFSLMHTILMEPPMQNSEFGDITFNAFPCMRLHHATVAVFESVNANIRVDQLLQPESVGKVLNKGEEALEMMSPTSGSDPSTVDRRHSSASRGLKNN